MSLYDVGCHALELAIVIPAAIMVYLPMRRWMRLSRRSVIAAMCLACAAIIVVGAVLCTRFGWPSSWVGLAVLPSICVVYCSIVTLRVGKPLFCFFNATMLAAFATVYVTVIAAPIEIGNMGDTFLPLTSVVCLALMVFLLELFFRTLTYKLPMLFMQESLNRTWDFAWLIPLALTLLLIWANPEDAGTYYLEGRSRSASLMLYALLPLAVFLFYDVVWRFSRSVLVSARLKQENDLLSMEEKRYQEMREYMSHTRNLRHDFRHHLLAIDQLAREGKNEELVQYVGQLTDVVGEGYRHLCANRVIDAVAARYEARAEREHTSIVWSLNLPEELPFNDTDLCAIVGNLVENALDAVAELPEEERTVDVSARLLSDVMLGITVKNPCKGKVRLTRRGLPRGSSKGAGRGVGLESVASIVRGYHGTLDIEATEGRFEVGVLLYAPAGAAAA